MVRSKARVFLLVETKSSSLNLGRVTPTRFSLSTCRADTTSSTVASSSIKTQRLHYSIFSAALSTRSKCKGVWAPHHPKIEQRVSDMRSNKPPQFEDLPVVVSDPDIEKQVSPLTLPNGVVSEPPKATATATATASRRVLTLCWAYLILLLCLLVFGVIAASIYVPALLFYIIYGVLVVIAFGTALGLSLACYHAMGVVQRENKNAKNVPLGNHSGV